jgi:hypothetical protein
VKIAGIRKYFIITFYAKSKWLVLLCSMGRSSCNYIMSIGTACTSIVLSALRGQGFAVSERRFAPLA